MAAGNGVVERANRFGSFGNYIRIRHANGYQTAYAHLNGFARNIRAGSRVTQGQTIGYVGTTGRSTGPHLHYEVHHNGNPVNPMTLDLPTGRQLADNEIALFEAERDRILAIRDAAPSASSGNAPLMADAGKRRPVGLQNTLIPDTLVRHWSNIDVAPVSHYVRFSGSGDACRPQAQATVKFSRT